MRRIMVLILAMMFVLLPAAHALGPAYMQVVNCDEWVSLRSFPDKSADRLAKVPLGEVVRGFYGSDNGFTICEYGGEVGYILNQYLQEVDGTDWVELPESAPDEEIMLADGFVRMWYEYDGMWEQIFVGRYDSSGALMFSNVTETMVRTELSGVYAFVNAHAQEPLLMLYNADVGLEALDLQTGGRRWLLPAEQVDLGMSVCHVVAPDGTMYIGGYYGPDPVAVSADGRVIWEANCADAGQDFFWLYEMEAIDGGILARYENGDEPVLVHFDGSGQMREWTWTYE